jgi:hypothetical protein
MVFGGGMPTESQSFSVVGDGSPNHRSDLVGGGLAEAMLKDTVNYPFVGDVIDHLKVGRTAFYRYFPPDRIRELRNQA